MRHLGIGGKEFQAPPKLAAVQRLRRYVFVVRNHPAQLMHPAIAPQQPAYLPDVTLRPAMRAGTDRTAPREGKFDDVVSVCSHEFVAIGERTVKLATRGRRGCDPALKRLQRARVYAENETCAGLHGDPPTANSAKYGSTPQYALK